MKCEICESLIENKDLIYETKYWKIVLADNQEYLGRCYISLKRHCGDLAELKKEEWLDFIELVKKIESSLKKAFNATMFNWTCLMNNAYKNNLPNPHVHWHLRSRYQEKVEFEGIKFEDKEFGSHYNRDRKLIVSKGIQKKIIEKIKENL